MYHTNRQQKPLETLNSNNKSAAKMMVASSEQQSSSSSAAVVIGGATASAMSGQPTNEKQVNRPAEGPQQVRPAIKQEDGSETNNTSFSSSSSTSSTSSTASSSSSTRELKRELCEEEGGGELVQLEDQLEYQTNYSHSKFKRFADETEHQPDDCNGGYVSAMSLAKRRKQRNPRKQSGDLSASSSLNDFEDDQNDERKHQQQQLNVEGKSSNFLLF